LGAIVNVNGTTLVSYQDGTDFGVMAVNPDLKATATYEGLDLYAKTKRPVNITNWTYAEISCKSLPNYSSISFYYKIDKGDTWTQALMENGSGTFSSTNEKKAVFLIGEEGQIFEAKIVLTPYVNTSPEVLKMRIYFG